MATLVTKRYSKNQLPSVDKSGFGEHGDRFELHFLDDLFQIAAQDVLGLALQLAGRHHDPLHAAHAHLHLENNIIG